MIFKLEFTDKTEFAQAKTLQDLQIEYVEEFGKESLTGLKAVTIIDDETSKTIMLKNTDESTFKECPEFSLYDASVGNDFIIIGSTEWD